MTRKLWILLFFIIATAGLMVFNIIVLGLGDPKFSKDLETALVFYFPIWLAFYTPQMVIGWLMFTIKIPMSINQTNAFLVFTILTLLVMEVSFLLDIGLMFLAVEWVSALFVAWLIRRWLLTINQ